MWEEEGDYDRNRWSRVEGRGSNAEHRVKSRDWEVRRREESVRSRGRRGLDLVVERRD